MFTKRELNMLADPYFEVIRVDDRFVEVKSKCTGHCWNVFKNNFESRMKIVLYHKHTEETKYYHKQRICGSVADAVKVIQDHDEYVMLRHGEKSVVSVG